MPLPACAAQRLHGHSGPVASAVYAPNGATVMTVGDDGRVIVWDPRSGTQQAVLSGPGGHVQDAQVSPDGSTLYTAGIGGVVLAWDLTGARGFGQSARLSATVPCCGTVSPVGAAFALSPDGTEFAVPTGPSTVGVFSSETLRRELSFTIGSSGEPITALAWSPAGGILAVRSALRRRAAMERRRRATARAVAHGPRARARAG